MGEVFAAIGRGESFDQKTLFEVTYRSFNCSMISSRGGVLPYMGYIGMCRCEGYGFQAVYSRIGYVNQSVWV